MAGLDSGSDGEGREGVFDRGIEVGEHLASECDVGLSKDRVVHDDKGVIEFSVATELGRNAVDLEALFPCILSRMLAVHERR